MFAQMPRGIAKPSFVMRAIYPIESPAAVRPIEAEALHFAVSFARDPTEPWETIAGLLCNAVPAFLEAKDEYERTPLELAEERHGEQSKLRQLILRHDNTSYEQKEPFLQQALGQPNKDRISCIPPVIRSLGKKGFLKLAKDRDRIARLSDRESIAAWTDTCMTLAKQSDEIREVDIPCHFVVRGYKPKEMLSTMEKLKNHWEAQEQGSSTEKLTRPDAIQPHDDPGWSIVDWAKSFCVDDTTVSSIRKQYQDSLVKFLEEGKGGRKAEVASADTKYMFDVLPTKYRESKLLKQWLEGVTSESSTPPNTNMALHQSSNSKSTTIVCCSEILTPLGISITEEISASLPDTTFVCLRTTLPLRPETKDSSIEVRIIK